jgi:hypothetical protein
LIAKASAAPLWLACCPLAAASVCFDPGAVRRLAERLRVPVKRVGVGIFRGLRVVIAAHPEVWEVVEVGPEDAVAVFVVGPVFMVGPGVKNVLMPDLVNQLARDDVGVGVCEVKSQESSVLQAKLVCEVELAVAHARALLRICQLRAHV